MFRSGHLRRWKRVFQGLGFDRRREGRLVGICLDAGINLFDTAESIPTACPRKYSGKAIQGRRHELLISTKATFRFGKGPNDVGSSRYHLIQACEGSLKRLGTDHIDIYHMHGFDALTPIDEVLYTLDTLVRGGKVRYIACSNFSGWHLMKSLTVGKARLGEIVSHQVYYSLVGRDYENELMPLGLDQKVGAMIWSPLGWGRLTGKIRRGQPLPKGAACSAPPIRASGSRGISLPGCRCDRCRGEGNGKDGRADCAELAAAQAYGLDARHRRAQ